jgi:hypothetical protein
MVRLPGQERAAALEPLDEARDPGFRMEPQQQMNVIRDEAHLEHADALLPRDGPEEPAEEAGQARVEEPGTPARPPHDVAVESVSHAPTVAWAPPAGKPRERGPAQNNAPRRG